ncbi:MAG: HEAT repeat domain-containing protein [Phycisphaerae bacterium]|nr:HEAT repeat domain-containing protein [Phycisphaerae bacterium]
MPNIHSDDPDERILGICEAAKAKDRRAVPLLVDRLEDEDDAVRFYAIGALDRITGKRLGYDYAEPLSDRAKAVERWRRYVRDSGRAGSPEAEQRERVGEVPAAAAVGRREPVQ